MNDPLVLNLIAQFVPADARPWIVAALRHDPIVWNELQSSALASCLQQRLAQEDPFRPDQWSPGAMALLQMGLQIPSEVLRAPAKLSLEADTQKTAHQSLEALISQASPPSLAQAGWTALSWRIQFDQKKPWQPVLDSLLTAPQGNWATPLACLYDYVPQPSQLVRALLTQGAPAHLHAFALHILLSNPLPPGELVELLLSNAEGHTDKTGWLTPGEQLRLLKWLSVQRPQAARLYSQRCLKTAGARLHALASQITSTEVTPVMLEYPLLLAELYRQQEQPEQSLDLLSTARTGVRSLLSDLYAQSAMLGSDLNGPSAEQSIETELNWRAAAQSIPIGLASAQATAYQPGLILHLLQQGKLQEAQALLPPLADLPAAGAPMQIAAAQCACQAGNCAEARQNALQALKAWQDSDALIAPALAGNGSRLIISRLPGILESLGLHTEAAQALNMLLSQSPADAGLLSRLSANLIQTGNLKAALNAIQIAAALSPDCPKIKQQLIACLENLGRWADALVERRARIEALVPNNQKPSLDDWLALAHCALQAGQPEAALPASQEALNLAPENGVAHLYQGQAFLRLDDLDQALQHLVQATMQSPELPQAWLSLAEAQVQSQQEQQALETLRTAAQALPGSAGIFFALGSRHLAENHPTQAVAALQQAASLDPSAADIALLLGQTQASLGYQEEAIQVLCNAYQQEPFYPGLAYAYAQVLLARNACAQAITPLETAIQSSPEAQQQEILIALGSAILAAWARGDPSAMLSRAISALQQALAILPAPAEAQGLLAEALLANGEHAQALKVYQTVFDTNLAQNAAWASRLPFGLGRAALALGQYETAIAALQEAVQADPANPAIYRALSEAQQGARLDLNAYQAACAAIEVGAEDTNTLLWFANQIDQLFPTSPASPTEPTTAARAQALQALEQAAALSPQRADVHLRLAEQQLRAGQQNLAVQSYKRVFETEINTSADLQTAGTALLEFGEIRTAINCLERSVVLERRAGSRLSPGLLASLSRAYRQAGNLELALDHLEQALPLDSRNPMLYLEKARLLQELRRDENALACLEQGIENTPLDHQQASLHQAGAQIHRSQGNLPAALLHARLGLHLCQAYPPPDQDQLDFSLIHLALLNLTAEMYRSLLQPDQARQLLEQDTPTAIHSLAPSTPEALENLCLHAELTLDAGDQAEFQPALPPNVSIEGKPRLFALQTRLAVRTGAGENSATESTRQALDGIVSQTIRQSDRQPPISQCLALFEAALELPAWEIAREIVEAAIKWYPAEPLVHLARARWLTLRAEFQHLCQANQVTFHAPGQEALSAASQNDLLDAIDAVNRLLNEFQTRAQIAKALKTVAPGPASISSLETVPANPVLVRWQVRGQAAFSTQAQDIDQILPTIYRRPGRAFQYAAEDAAALIAALNRLSPATGAPAITKTILQAARPYPKHPLVLIQVALALASINPAEALKTAQAAAKASFSGAAVYAALANALSARLAHLSGDHAAAQAFIEQALTLWPEEPRWQFLAADICAASHEADQAINHLENAVQQDPAYLAAQMALGKAYLSTQSGSSDHALQAIPIFQRAAQLSPGAPEPLICLAQAQLQANLLPEATQSAEQAAALGGDSIEPLLMLADITLHQDDHQASLGYAQRAYQQCPEDPEAAIRLAQALHALQRTAEAIQIIEKAIPGAPDALPLQLFRASLLRQSGKLDAALEVYKELVLQKTATPQVFALLAKTLAEKDELPSAVRAAQRAVQASPKEMSAAEKGELHALLGHLMRISGQLDQAIHHLSAAVLLIPNALDPHLELGLARKERREYPQALQIFQRATAIAPQDPRPHYQAGLALKDSKDYREAETMLRRAASLAPEDVNIRKQLAAVVALNLVHNPKPRGIQR